MIMIIGAGLSGLLAANMLHHRTPEVIEKQAALPNNHSAVLRFRSTVVGDVTNIQFKKVKMIKTSIIWKNPVADALSYANKVGGILRSDRSITNPNDDGTRYIAPPDLINQLAAHVSIRFNTDGMNHLQTKLPIISTMPMPILMRTLNYPHMNDLTFNYHHGTNIHATIDRCDAYVSLMFPNPSIPISRATITGDQLIIEGPVGLSTDDAVACALEHFGISINRVSDISVHDQQYAKINQLFDDDARREFIFWATNEFNIYSLGRFATWRPGLLLDDLVQDIRLIDKWVAKRDRYSLKQRRAS